MTLLRLFQNCTSKPQRSPVNNSHAAARGLIDNKYNFNNKIKCQNILKVRLESIKKISAFLAECERQKVDLNKFHGDYLKSIVNAMQKYLENKTGKEWLIGISPEKLECACSEISRLGVTERLPKPSAST